MNYFRCGGGRSTHTATKIDVAKTPLATFESNVSGLYIPEILAYIQATQAGTGDPSPSNPRAINGVSEVTTACNAINQWDEEWEQGAYSASTGNKTSSGNDIRSKDYILVVPNTTYYINCPKTVIICGYDQNKNYLGYIKHGNANTTFKTLYNGNPVYYINFCTYGNSYGTTYNNDVSINYPATDTAYHAYTGTTATTSLGGTYYGGYLNVTTGLLTVTHAKYKIRDLGTFVRYTNFFTINIGTLGFNITDHYKCETFNNVGLKYDVAMQQQPNYSLGYSSTSFKFRYDDSTDVNSFLEDVGDDIVIFELATPQTYQLTPAQITQLLGQNNVFCSSGDVAVKYWKID